MDLNLGQPQKKMSYEELMQECQALVEDLRMAQEDTEYYKKAYANEAAYAAKGVTNTSRERFADRVLKQQVPENQKPVSEDLYLTRSSLLESLILIPSLSRADARRFIRDWEDIETLAQGGGNEQIVKVRQERLIFELAAMRAIGDAPIVGMTTMSALITDRHEEDQKINMPPQRKPQGWLDALANIGGGGNQ